MATPPQQIFSDRYEPLRLIARGGMAEVWLARDGLLDRMVALKVLFPELSVDPNFVERFRREAQAAANLSHPNIVSVYDWGEAGGTYFIVMEYIEGRPLSAVLRDEGPLLADRAASIGADVAAALGFAHRNGVIHRDVKPGNVLLTTDDHVKVTDFGIARAANTEDHLTQTGAVMGTATYFSPEQAQGLQVDQRSDVYALGVVLYEMVTGRPPFVADSPVATAYKHVHEDPVAPTSIKPEIPAAFEAIVLQALAKQIPYRYASAEELRADLLRFRQGRSVLAEPPPLVSRPAATRAAAPRAKAPPAAPAVAAAQTATRMVAASEPAELEDGGGRSLVVYAVLLAILVAALGVVLFLLGRQLDLFGNGGANAAAAKPVAIPADLIGKQYSDAANELKQLGVTNVTRKDVSDATHPAESVTATNPAAGQTVAIGVPVELDVASGPAAVNEPDVVGEDVKLATQQLETAGFKVAAPVTQDSDNIPAGQVMNQNPPQGSQLHQGDTVTLTVSDGKGQALVPDVVGKDQATAENVLQQAALGSYVAGHEYSTKVPAGSVSRTSPDAGTAVTKGSKVGLYLSRGPAKVYLPNVKGYTESSARQTLEGKGFVVTETTEAVSRSSEDGTVIDQSPGGGTYVDDGSTVSLVIGQYTPTTSTTPTTNALGF